MGWVVFGGVGGVVGRGQIQFLVGWRWWRKKSGGVEGWRGGGERGGGGERKGSAEGREERAGGRMGGREGGRGQGGGGEGVKYRMLHIPGILDCTYHLHVSCLCAQGSSIAEYLDYSP